LRTSEPYYRDRHAAPNAVMSASAAKNTAPNPDA